MSLSGVNIACGYARVGEGVPLMAALAWSRTMASPGVTDVAARSPAKVSPGDTFSTLAFEIISDKDIWVAWGVAPDATQSSGNDASARIYVRAREVRTIYCNRGDFLAWATS